MQPTYQNVSLIVEAAYDKSKKYVHLSCLLVHGPTPRPQPGTFGGVPKLKPDGIFSLSHSCFKILVSHKNEKKRKWKKETDDAIDICQCTKVNIRVLRMQSCFSPFFEKVLTGLSLSSVHLTYLHHKHNISLR